MVIHADDVTVEPSRARAPQATTTPSFVIVGAGLAGAKAAEALRALGFDGRISLIGAETHRPYERPALSKDYLNGTTMVDKTYVHSPDWYSDNQVTLHLDTTVTTLDRRTRHLLTGAGERLRYDKVLLTTGSSPRRLTVAGAEVDGLLYLRTLEDSDRIRQALRPDARVVIIGGGWIGLETAAAARAAGAAVTVLEHGRLPLVRILGPRIASVFADLHRDHGVDLRCGVHIADISRTGDSSFAIVTLTDGSTLPADVVIVGVGVKPNIELAQAAGLRTDNGIVVDAQGRTDDPAVFAAGDVANAYHPVIGKRLRVEHWANAVHQPIVAANAMLGGTGGYHRLPYFYSDQYDLGMEYTGHAEPGDDLVIRGDLSTRKFIAFWTRHGRVTAGMNVNIWDVAGGITTLIQSQAAVDPDRLANPGIPLEKVHADALTHLGG